MIREPLFDFTEARGRAKVAEQVANYINVRRLAQKHNGTLTRHDLAEQSGLSYDTIKVLVKKGGIPVREDERGSVGQVWAVDRYMRDAPQLNNHSR